MDLLAENWSALILAAYLIWDLRRTKRSRDDLHHKLLAVECEWKIVLERQEHVNAGICQALATARGSNVIDFRSRVESLQATIAQVRSDRGEH